jgi:hypothetical protein
MHPFLGGNYVRSSELFESGFTGFLGLTSCGYWLGLKMGVETAVPYSYEDVGAMPLCYVKNWMFVK